MTLSARLFAGLLLPLLVFVHEERFPDSSLARTREVAGDWDRKAESTWQKFAGEALAHAIKERDFVRSEILVNAHPELERPEIELDAEAKRAALQSQASYGKLPEVIADHGIPAVFPKPIDPPTRFSSFRAAVDTGRALGLIRRLKAAVKHWKDREVTQRGKELRGLISGLQALDEVLLNAAQELRISHTWVPRHLLALQEAQGPTQVPRAYHALDALMGKGQASEKVSDAREALRPKREVYHPFLPMSFQSHRGKTIRIPAVTDISSARFLEEFEGAVDTYWNQSPWARKHGIRFAFDWQKVPLNARFLKNEEDLENHLKRFPPKKMILTTGAQSSQVIRNAMVIGPGKITPRTLAHEFGHILGFPDCYMRTISGEGMFGIAVLEWSNPFFPDELMCDNHLGVVHAVLAE